MVIRVGVINYADYDKTYTDKQQSFNALATNYNKSPAAADKRISFQVSVGSYDDILAWYKNGLIDVAILSPGPTAELVSTPNNDEIKELYIATVTSRPAAKDNLLAPAARRRNENQVTYYSVCIVSSKSDVQNWEQLYKEIKDHNVEFLFVHPLSASGRILPEYVLRQFKGITEEELHKGLAEVKWTYDHAATMKALQEPSEKTRVAFVWDTVGDDAKNRAAVRKIPIPELDQTPIPQEVVLITSNFKAHKQMMKDIFVPKDRNGNEYTEVNDWVEQYQAGVVQWVKALDLKPSKLGQSFFSLEQIISKVRSYENTHPGNSRIALVLSGGGAKCAYQIGVIRAIENQIAAHNEEFLNAKVDGEPPTDGNALPSPSPAPRPLDIGLVVGTSGGAINALSVALGLTRNEEGQEALQNVWLSFQQKDFFRPWTPVPFTLGLIIGFSQALLIIVALRLFDERKIQWRERSRFVIGVLSLLAVVLLFTQFRFWASLPIMIAIVYVGLQLFENQSDNWRSRAAIVLLASGIIEFVLLFTNVSPWRAFPFVLATFAFLFAAIVMVVGIRVFTNDAGNWLKYFGVAMPVIAVALFAVLMLWNSAVQSIWQLSKNHVLHHVWMAFTMNLPVSAICLAAIGALILIAELTERSKPSRVSKSRRVVYELQELQSINQQFFVNRKQILRTLVISLIILICLQVGRSLLVDKSLSSSEGLDYVFAQKLPLLLEKHPDTNGKVEVAGSNDHEKLSDLSKQIIGKGWLKRDLIITTSLLSHGDDPPDLYFYHHYSGDGAYQGKTPDRTFPPDLRFKSFSEQDYMTRLLDVIIGSATIYPVFDPRNVSLAQSMQSGDNNARLNFDLIDGGFAHNSPIEAAVAWGATHIILIEASPEPKASSHRHLLDNSVDAFNYLFNRAQLTDARSRGKIEIFSIRPEPDPFAASPNLCTFDFDEFLMKDKIEEGWNDALLFDSPKFRRERGQPN
jgi:predicted acylesterase/phospholipase RssA/ABC-type phosphate/phosphonate transport system substrate-binding protein